MTLERKQSVHTLADWMKMILGLDFTTHNDDTLRADEGQVQDDSKNNDITEEDDDCQYISVISNSIHDNMTKGS